MFICHKTLNRPPNKPTAAEHNPKKLEMGKASKTRLLVATQADYIYTVTDKQQIDKDFY
jgi:hypothetical protein